MELLEKIISNKWNNILVIALITLLAYSLAMRGGFILDDELTLVSNNYEHDLNHLGQIFTHSTTAGAGVKDGNFYRPLQGLCQATIYSVFGSSATPQYIFSVLLHVANACLLFLLLSLLGFSNIPALLAAIIFAVHPINTEAVAYISDLSDPLSLLFILSACIFFIEYRKTAALYFAVFTAIAAVLALLSRESSVMLCVLLPLIEIYFQPQKIIITNRIRGLLANVLLLCLGFVYLKFTSFNFTGNNSFSTIDNAYTQSILSRAITFLTIFPRYMGMLLFPVYQYIEKPYLAYVSLGALGFGGVMMLGALGYLCFTSFTGDKKLFLGIGIFLALLLPVSGIIAFNVIYQEHWLYLPFVGFTIAIATVLQQVMQNRKTLLLVICAVVIFIYAAKSMYRNYQWADAVRFYKNELTNNKKSTRIYNNLALIYSEKKDFNSAINYYTQAINVYDAYPQTHHNLALAYLQVNQISLAIAEEYKALEMQPNFVFSLQSLYDIYATLKDEKRMANFERYIKQADEGKVPLEWNEIKENLHADK